MANNTADNIGAYRQSFQSRLRRERQERESRREAALQMVRSVVPSIIAQYPGVKAAYIFGSILRPNAFRIDSDIDIAIEGDSAEEYFALWRELEAALSDWFIDLRDLPAGTRFAQRVYETGEKIYG